MARNKFISLESEDDNKSPLTEKQSMIDKVMDFVKTDTNPLSLTAKVIQQRSELKKEIESELNKEDDDSDNSDDDNETKSNDDSDNSSDDNKSSDNDNQDNNKPQDDSSDNKDTEDDEDEKDTSDFSNVNSKEDVAGLIGSGLTEDKDKKNIEDDKEKQKKVSNEEYVHSANKELRPLMLERERYKTSLESYGIKRVLSLEEQPVAYIKDGVTKSLNNLVSLAEKYIELNVQLHNKITNFVTVFNEKITTYKTYLENEKIKYNYKIIKDSDVLLNLSFPGESDILKTSKKLIEFNDDTMKLVLHILNNDFDHISSAVSSSGYSKKEETVKLKAVDAFTYGMTVPGFYQICLALPAYTNYVNTSIRDYNFYRVRTASTNNTIDLDAIELTKDNDLKNLISNLDKILVDTLSNNDNIKTITQGLKKFIELIKIKIYDVSQNQVKNLTSIGIDKLLKDFIKFKLVLELINISTEINNSYLNSSLTVLEKTVEVNP